MKYLLLVLMLLFSVSGNAQEEKPPLNPRCKYYADFVDYVTQGHYQQVSHGFADKSLVVNWYSKKSDSFIATRFHMNAADDLIVCLIFELKNYKERYPV